MSRLKPMDHTGGTYLLRSPDHASPCRAADCHVERVEYAQLHRKRERQIASNQAEKHDPFGAPSPTRRSRCRTVRTERRPAICSLLDHVSPDNPAHGSLSTVTRRVEDEPVPRPTSAVVGTRSPNRGEYHPRTGSSSAVCDVQARPSGSSSDPWWRSEPTSQVRAACLPSRSTSTPGPRCHDNRSETSPAASKVSTAVSIRALEWSVTDRRCTVGMGRRR